MLYWWPFLAASSYRLSVPTIYVQNSVSFTNSFSRIIFINSLSPILFYKFNITNSFSRINLRIRKSSKNFVRIHTTLFWFAFAKSVLCCEQPVLYYLCSIIRQREGAGRWQPPTEQKLTYFSNHEDDIQS